MDDNRPPLPHDVREMIIERVKRKLLRLDHAVYKTLAEPSCGVIDPHYKERERAAESLARILVRP